MRICGSSETSRLAALFNSSWCDRQSHLAVSQETWVRNGLNLAYGHYWFFFMPKGSFTCRKSTTWDRRKWCSGFLSPLKIHWPRTSTSNPRTLGPVASTLTTSPPRSAYILYYNILLITPTCFDPLWDHHQEFTFLHFFIVYMNC
jgi:hypothetical protein